MTEIKSEVAALKGHWLGIQEKFVDRQRRG